MRTERLALCDGAELRDLVVRGGVQVACGARASMTRCTVDGCLTASGRRLELRSCALEHDAAWPTLLARPDAGSPDPVEVLAADTVVTAAASWHFGDHAEALHAAGPATRVELRRCRLIGSDRCATATDRAVVRLLDGCELRGAVACRKGGVLRVAAALLEGAQRRPRQLPGLAALAVGPVEMTRCLLRAGGCDGLPDRASLRRCVRVGAP